MKSRDMMAISIGMTASVVLAALEAKIPHIIFESLQAPGFFTIIILWGPHGGGGVPDFVREMVMIGVNAVAYSLVALGVFWFLSVRRSSA
jgi:hypothetical protein